jgi:hypothetical protein
MYISKTAFDIILILGIPCVLVAVAASIGLLILDIKDLLMWKKNRDKYNEMMHRWED